MRQAREARKIYNAQDEIKKQAYADIAKARFAIEGASSYPDATFTLRLSYGTVRGYEQDGKQIPAFTDFAGLYQRAAEHDNRPPFDLPKRWLDKKIGPQSGDEIQFRFRCRHYRRQQRQSGGEQSKRIRRHYFRRQHSITGGSIAFTRTHRRAPSLLILRRSSKRCEKFTTRARSRMNWKA